MFLVYLYYLKSFFYLEIFLLLEIDIKTSTFKNLEGKSEYLVETSKKPVATI